MNKVEDFHKQTMLLPQSDSLICLHKNGKAALSFSKLLLVNFRACQSIGTCFSSGLSKSKTMAFTAFHPRIYRICIAINLMCPHSSAIGLSSQRASTGLQGYKSPIQTEKQAIGPPAPCSLAQSSF